LDDLLAHRLNQTSAQSTVDIGSAADEIPVAGDEVLLLWNEDNDVSSETVQELASECIDPPHRI
jgi:hypothetical protein